MIVKAIVETFGSNARLVRVSNLHCGEAPRCTAMAEWATASKDGDDRRGKRQRWDDYGWGRKSEDSWDESSWNAATGDFKTITWKSRREPPRDEPRDELQAAPPAIADEVPQCLEEQLGREDFYDLKIHVKEQRALQAERLKGYLFRRGNARRYHGSRVRVAKCEARSERLGAGSQRDADPGG
jgi:hypothetical protein